MVDKPVVWDSFNVVVVASFPGSLLWADRRTLFTPRDDRVVDGRNQGPSPGRAARGEM